MNLIEKLKHNEKPFGLNTKEERECFKEVGSANCQIQAAHSVRWFNCNQMGIDHFGTAAVFRIKPDYQPEPEVEKCEVDIGLAGIYYSRQDCKVRDLHEALSDPDFMWFECESGHRIASPRILVQERKVLLAEPALIPKYVVFAKKCKP